MEASRAVVAGRGHDSLECQPSEVGLGDGPSPQDGRCPITEPAATGGLWAVCSWPWTRLPHPDLTAVPVLSPLLAPPIPPAPLFPAASTVRLWPTRLLLLTPRGCMGHPSRILPTSGVPHCQCQRVPQRMTIHPPTLELCEAR